MLATVLASQPHTPGPILDALVEHAQTMPATHTRRVLTRTLVANPSVPVTTVAALITAADHKDRRDLTEAALRRPGLDIADVLTDANVATDAPTLCLLAEMPDPDGTRTWKLLTVLDTVAATDPQVAETVWAHLVRTPTIAPAHAQDAAARLAALPTRDAATDATLCDHAELTLDEASTPAQYAAATAHVRALAASAPQLRRGLDHALASYPAARPVQVGTTDWLDHPATTTADVVAWLDGRDGNDWATALTHHHDPTFTLARGALAAHPHHRAVLERLAHRRNPTDLQQRALRNWITLSPTVPDVYSYTVFTGGDPDLAVELACTIEGDTPRVVLDRPDLTVKHIDALIAAQSWPEHSFAVALLTHPNATPDQRAIAARMLETCVLDPAKTAGNTNARLTALAAHLASLCALLTSLDPTDQAAALAITSQLSVPDHVATLDNYPTFASLVTSTVVTLLGPAPDPDTLAVLLRLAPTFPGTLADLVTTARTITT